MIQLKAILKLTKGISYTIQLFKDVIKPLDSGFHRSDDFLRGHQERVMKKELSPMAGDPMIPPDLMERGDFLLAEVYANGTPGVKITSGRKSHGTGGFSP